MSAVAGATNMRTTGFLRQAVVMTTLAALHSTTVAADPIDRAATLSAALGGALGDGMIAAGHIGHGKLGTAPESRLGRSDLFRRQVAASPAYVSSSSSAGSRRL